MITSRLHTASWSAHRSATTPGQSAEVSQDMVHPQSQSVLCGVQELVTGKVDALEHLMATAGGCWMMSWDDYAIMNDRTLTTDTAGDDWETMIVDQARGNLEDDAQVVDDSGDDEVEPETFPIITRMDPLFQIKNIVGFALGESVALHLCWKQH